MKRTSIMRSMAIAIMMLTIHSIYAGYEEISSSTNPGTATTCLYCKAETPNEARHGLKAVVSRPFASVSITAITDF